MMDTQPTRRKLKLLWTWAFGLFAVTVICGFGWQAGEFRSRTADSEMRDRLVYEAEQVVLILDPKLVRQLTFTRADEATPTFELIRDQLTRCGEDLSIRGIFTMARRGESIYFGPETYDENDPVASPPGTEYLQPPAEALTVFKTKRPATVGPYVDEFGSFVTALAPLIDPETGEVLLVVGLDRFPEQWQAEVAAVRRSPLLTSLATLRSTLSG